MSASNDLTFIRCPSCRSLVPAVSSRCRMCGNSLRSDAQPESTEERKTARVRQPTASLSSVEADRLREEAETLHNYPMTHPEEALVGEEGEAELGGLEASAAEEALGGSDLAVLNEDASSEDEQVALELESAGVGFEEGATDIGVMIEAKGGEESELWARDEGEFKQDENTPIETLAEVSIEAYGLDSGDGSDDSRESLDLGDVAASSFVSEEHDAFSDRGNQLSPVVLEETGGEIDFDVRGASEVNEATSGWQDAGDTKLLDEQDTPDIPAVSEIGAFEDVGEARKQSEVETGELHERSSGSVRGVQRTPRPLQFGRRQAAPGAEQTQPRAQMREGGEVRAAQRIGRPHESSSRWGSYMKGGSGTETPSTSGRTERFEPARPSSEPSRDPVGRGRAIANTRTAAANLADVLTGRLFGWLVSYKDSSGAAIELREGKTLLTGSSLKKGDLVIDAPSISTPHAMFTMRSDSGLFVQDLMSERGVWVRRKQEDTYQREDDGVELKHGDWVRFGDEEFLVSLVPYLGVQ